MNNIAKSFLQIQKWGGVVSGDKVEVYFVTVTPELAKNLLNNNYHKQRAISENTVLMYVEDMKNGLWNERMLDTIIKVTPEFHLLNGQHRMTAVIKYGKPVVMPFMFDVSEDEYIWLDNGKRRSAQNYIDAKYRSSVVALARVCLLYERTSTISFGTVATTGNSLATRPNIVSYANENLELLVEISKKSNRMKNAIKCYGAAIYGFFIWVVMYTHNDDYINAFITDFCEDAPMNRTVQACKSKLIKTYAVRGQNRMPSNYNNVFALLFGAYEHFRRNDGVAKLDQNAWALKRYESMACDCRAKNRMET